MLVSPSSAAVIVQTIDDFEAGNFSLEFPNGANATGTLSHELSSDPQVFGGRRGATWEVMANPAAREASASVVFGGNLSVLFISTESGVEASLSLDYGGAGTTADLEQDNADALMFVFASLNQSIDLSVAVTGVDGTRYEGSARASSTGDHMLPFTEFAGYQQGNFSEVREIEVRLQSPTSAPDFLMDGIHVTRPDTVPEPSAALLGMLCAPLLISRRRH